MQHVDEGQLAAYVDGALNQAEHSAVDEHVRACADCRATVVELRRMAEQARTILAGAGPRMGDVPSFDAVMARAKRGSRGVPAYVRPLVWAATLVLAVGVGWYGRALTPNPSPAEREFGRRRFTLTPYPSPAERERGRPELCSRRGTSDGGSCARGNLRACVDAG